MNFASSVMVLGSGWWSWLLGVRDIDPSDPSVQLGWEHPLPAWAWTLIVAALIAISVFSYRRMLGPKPARSALTVARTLTLVLVAVLLARPELVLPREVVEPDRVLMLLDRSASMRVTDLNLEAVDPTQRQSRETQLRALLGDHATLWSDLEKDHRLDWYAFDQTLRDLTGPDPGAAPEGRGTALRTAIDEALRRATGRPIGGVVVFSDGRSAEPIDTALVERLRQAGAPVFAVPLGSAHAPPDLWIRVEAPVAAFVDDVVPVTVTVGAAGGDQVPPGAELRLVDQTTGAVLDHKPVTALDQPIRLKTSPRAAGAATWRVELVNTGAEPVLENNTQTLDLNLTDRPIRILYVDAYPRWEYRYLKNLMIREKSVESSIMLISADRNFAQEGDVPLRRLPETDAEIDPYDVVVIGDVPAGFFTAEQIALLLKHVNLRGAGLMWIGGQHHTPESFATTPLAALLPMPGTPSRTPLEFPIHLTRTPAAEALGVLQLREKDAPDAAWPTTLPPLAWAQAISTLKPAAEALAVDPRGDHPLVVRMRYGAGSSIYVATDEIWRWRYGRGELWGEQFWMQLIRLLARYRLRTGGGDDRARLLVSAPRATTEQRLVVRVEVDDQAMLNPPPETLRVEVTDAETAARRGAAQTLTLRPEVGQPGRYRAAWTPHLAGRRLLRVTTPALADLDLRQTVHVDRSDDELRQPAADHGLLAGLAERSGGAVIAPDKITDLMTQIPNRARRTPADLREPLWHSPMALGLLILLLAVEWIGRRVIGLA